MTSYYHRILFLFFSLIMLLRFSQVSSDVAYEQQLVVRGANRRLMAYVNCGALCAGRCSRHSHPNRCSRACGTCCARCKCVPPGTSGNRHLCGTCYTDMTTHFNKTKCP